MSGGTSPENAARASDETARLLDSIGSILVALDGEGCITRWNDAAREAFGVGQAEVLGRGIGEVWTAWKDAPLDAAVRRCSELGERVRIDEMRYVRSDGSEGILGLTLNPVEAPERGQRGVLLLASDITGIKARQTRITHGQKMQSIGRLAAGIAHEINTPTQFVGDNIHFLRDAFEDIFGLLAAYEALLAAVRGSEGGRDPAACAARVEGLLAEADLPYLAIEVPQAIEQSLEGVRRVSRIIASMKQFSHPGEEKGLVDVNKLLGSTLTVSRNEWKYVAEALTELDPGLPPVPGNTSELGQVFLNIVLNAAQAIAQGRGDDEGRKGLISVSTRSEDGHVVVAFTDDGPGMPEEVREKVFEPFFTTKEPGQGTGQGLSIAHSIVHDRHGGHIEVFSLPGQGTTFLVRLPMKDASRNTRELEAGYVG